MERTNSFDTIESGSFSGLPEKAYKFNTLKVIDLSKSSLDHQPRTINPAKLHAHKAKTIHAKTFSNSDSFLNSFKKMSDTPLKEQLQDVILLYQLKKKNIKGEIPHEIYSFCDRLIKNGPDRMPRYSGDIQSLFQGTPFDEAIQKNTECLTVSELRGTLGKFIFLLNKDIDKLNRLLMNKTQKEQIALIDKAFERELEKINSSIKKFEENHIKTGLQDVGRALSARIPIELAKALISDSGYVNIGIIESLMSKFLSEKRKIPFEKDIAFALNSIKKSSSLRQKILLIPAPFSQTSPANDLIRITLGLKQGAFTTSIDAKKTALAALISHMRQSPASSCFASYLAIEMLSKQLGSCLNDFCELLQKSHISRFVDGEEKEFTFLMRTGKESTSRKIKLDRTGKIFSDNNLTCYIYEVPGIKSACRSIGIKNTKKTLQDLSLSLAENNKTDVTVISISKILKMLAFIPEGDFSHNFNCAKLSFESELHNPLLRMWENVIASMAEGRVNGKIREALIQSVTTSLSKILGMDLNFRRKFVKNLHQNITEAAYFAYDTDIKSKNISADGRSERGAFILYNRSGSNHLNEWKLIENENDFRAFITSMVRKSFARIYEKQEILKEIKDFISTNKFIVDCLQAYHVDNVGKTEKELMGNIEGLAHKPWCDKTGNNSVEVLHIYSDKTNKEPLAILNPRNGERLLVDLIEIGRKFPDDLKTHLASNSNLLSPLIIKDVHACSMMFGSENLMRAIKSNKTPESFVLDHLLKPGREISESKLTKEKREQLIFLVAHTLPKEDKEGLLKFREKAALLAPDLSLSLFRNELILIIKEIHKEQYHPMTTIVNGIDFFIYKHILSKEAQEKIKSSRIHFADSNWSAGVHDVHFCFIFNPGSANIEVWEVYENGEGLYPLNQHAWVKKQNWQIYSP